MKTTLLAGLLLFSAAAQAYTVVENASLDAAGIRSLSIRTYSGPLTITGHDGDTIEVEVVIDFDREWEDGEAREALREGLVLDLERRGRRAHLDSWVGDYDVDDVSFFTWGLADLFRPGRSRPFSHLEIRVPKAMDLEISDGNYGEVFISRVDGDIALDTGAGDVDIADIGGDLVLQDQSGNVRLARVGGNVEIRDGSGNVDVEEVGGRLLIEDGSGNIDVQSVGGRLAIRDGSGDIRVTDLANDGDITDGSGEIIVRGVTGTLALEDGSGSIVVDGVGKELLMYSSGSGGLTIRNVRGEVIGDDRTGRGYNRNFNYNYNYRDRDRDIDIDEDVDIDIDIDEDPRVR